jgi:hypothetical protein
MSAHERSTAPAAVNTVGILTHHEAFNFGATLQAFALRRTIESIGCACSIIDVRDPSGVYRLWRWPVDRASVRHDALTLANLGSHLRSRSRFRSFRAAHLGITDRSYRTLADLAHASETFDAIVSGSDQVWHPHLLEGFLGRAFFQDFAGSSRRVAYAPSFGLSEVPDKYCETVRRLIARFDFVSSREDSGCAIIERLTGRFAEHVLDPTLLLPSPEYDRAAVEPTLRGPYILLYPMQWSERLRDEALRARRALGIPIVAILPPLFAPARFAFADTRVHDAGPAEFLGWMRGAELVCTNSFHGTCFSVIYRKRFLTVRHTSTGTRMQSLLDRLGLQSRLLVEGAAGDDNDLARQECQYASVEPRLADAIARSTSFLRGALT